MTSLETGRTSKRDSESISDDSVNAEQPTAFILKLFEMINGAPDEVIAWTLEGDAFVIGPNLKRLEAETLPQFFRHNRFQSFVRQLNFYSFRKINRERTTWVYKHDLFRRDHPEDLNRLRRRTCSAIDGRRQSLSRPLMKKTTVSGFSKRLSIEESDRPVRNHHSSQSLFKRSIKPIVKRPSIDWTSPVTTEGQLMPLSTHVLDTVPLTESEDSDDQQNPRSSNSNRSLIEDQSMVVLKIASQLAQHARNSWNGARISGLVTPPFTTTCRLRSVTGALLTYDDENERLTSTFCRDSPIKQIRCIAKEHLSGLDRQHESAIELRTVSQSIAEGVVERLLDALDNSVRESLSTAAKVASFCIMTLPSSLVGNVSVAIHGVLSSCGRLQSEFQLYRLALQPIAELSDSTSLTRVHEESCGDIIRLFSVFAVNKMQCLSLALNEAVKSNIIMYDVSTLEKAISLWQKYGTI